MKYFKPFFLLPILFLAFNSAKGNTDDIAASKALIQRIIPSHAQYFSVEIIAQDHEKDVFEIEAQNGKVILRGNNPVSVASALNWYLKYYCHCQVSWNGDNLQLPKILPATNGKVRKISPYKYRVCFNYCTFSYTMPWWDWSRWQREIDWMAMHGVNMPLAITGQEAVWQNTLRKFNMTDDEIRKFLVGPAYFAWQFMTNIEGWRGPLPQNWIDSHVTLGKQIITRERSLGMKVILQGFTGYVPRLLQQKYPQAKIACQGDWYGVPPGPAQLDPLDPLFPQMGKVFMEEQEKLFGTDHFYAADPFHEGTPPVAGDKYLQDVGHMIYQTMQSADKDAVVAMQTWSLREPIVKAIPDDKILLLNLTGSSKTADPYWGRAWVAGVLHNYGGRVFMGGNLPYYLSNAPRLLSDSASRSLQGIGIFTEATNQNPVVYDAASEITWMEQVPDVTKWLYDYQISRYGKPDIHAQKAWDILQSTLYAQKMNEPSMESPICARPVLQFKRVAPNGSTRRDYKPAELWQAWNELLQVDNAIKQQETYQYDLVDAARQCLTDLAIPIQKQFAAAFENKDMAGFDTYSKTFLDLMSDIDMLLATRKEFLLGKWLNEAKSWAKTPAESRLYEANARNLITAWGPVSPEAVQYDYSNRQWSGLINAYYKTRWEMFFTFLKANPDYSEKDLKWSYDRPAHYAGGFYNQLSDWEKQWIEQTSSFPDKPSGDPVKIAEKLYNKWVKAVL